MAGSGSNQAHEQRIYKEKQFRTLIQQSADAIQLATPEGVVLYSSDSVMTVIGYSPDEIQGVNVSPYIHPDDLPEFRTRWATLLETPKAHDTLEYRVKHKDGSWVWVETTLTNHLATPGIEAVVGNFRNITERKQALEALRRSEERWRFMAEAMPQKIFTATSEGHIEYINMRWSEFTGVPAEKLYGNGWLDFIHPDDLEDTVSRWEFSLHTGSPFSFEQRFRRYDGAYRWHVSRAVPMRDEHGNTTRWFGSNTDIHEIRLAIKREHELESRAVQLIEQRTQLVALNEAKDEFIALASHQLRTPATVVKQYLAMVLDGYAGELTPEQRGMIRNADISNERQISIINELLEVARLDAGKIDLSLHKTDIVKLVNDVAGELRPAIEELRQKITVTAECDDPNITVDSDKIRMVLENIITNASKYSPEDTHIRIKVSDTNGTVRIAVKDQGVGIGKEDLDKLFKKFSRLDNPLSVAVGGTGLGLYWASRIVGLHDGSIEVKSKLSTGSTFTVVLPRRKKFSLLGD